MHVLFGACYFDDPRSEWDTLAREISLNHHEKWDGSGYPGAIADLYRRTASRRCRARRAPRSPSPRGSSPSPTSTMRSSSKRAYKDAWEEDRVLHHMREESGRHFDPEIVGIFFEIYDVIKAIKREMGMMPRCRR